MQTYASKINDQKIKEINTKEIDYEDDLTSVKTRTKYNFKFGINKDLNYHTKMTKNISSVAYVKFRYTSDTQSP